MKIHFIIIFWIINKVCAFTQTRPALPAGRGASPIDTKTESLISKNTYTVFVGISDYQDPGIPDLHFADKDAEAFANYLRSNGVGKLGNAQFQVGLVYNLYKRYPRSAVENKKVIQLNTKNTIKYYNLSCSLRFGNKANEALNFLHNG